jgi:hypothetical protein
MLYTALQPFWPLFLVLQNAQKQFLRVLVKSCATEQSAASRTTLSTCYSLSAELATTRISSLSLIH